MPWQVWKQKQPILIAYFYKMKALKRYEKMYVQSSY